MEHNQSSGQGQSSAAAESDSDSPRVISARIGEVVFVEDASAESAPDSSRVPSESAPEVVFVEGASARSVSYPFIVRRSVFQGIRVVSDEGASARSASDSSLVYYESDLEDVYEEGFGESPSDSPRVHSESALEDVFWAGYASDSSRVFSERALEDVFEGASARSASYVSLVYDESDLEDVCEGASARRLCTVSESVRGTLVERFRMVSVEDTSAESASDSSSVWRERCRREGFHLRHGSRTPQDWRLFYVLCKNRRNLLKNPRAEHDLNHWSLLQNGGDQWRVEDIRVPHQSGAVQKNFVTSFGLCLKAQTIDLDEEGYKPDFMDHFQPDIKISDWYAPRHDCGSKYEIRVELLDHRKRPLQIFAPDTVYFEQWNDERWRQMTHVFRDYGPGVRYIRFIHGGKDTQFWAGWYGIRVTDSSVEICPAGVT